LRDKYRKVLEELAPNEAGQYKVKDNDEAFVIRARLKRASEGLDFKVKIKKRGNYITF